MSNQPSIQAAVSDDIHQILAMIRELADYEHESSKVQATHQTLAETLTFADDPSDKKPGYAKCLILRLPETPTDPKDTPKAVAGMALYFNNYSTWKSAPGIYLEDLFVRPQYRKRGYGKLLVQALAQEVVAIGGARLEWSCLKWNEPSLQFYRALGATEMQEWVGLRVDGENLTKLASPSGKQ